MRPASETLHKSGKVQTEQMFSDLSLKADARRLRRSLVLLKNPERTAPIMNRKATRATTNPFIFSPFHVIHAVGATRSSVAVAVKGFNASQCAKAAQARRLMGAGYLPPHPLIGLDASTNAISRRVFGRMPQGFDPGESSSVVGARQLDPSMRQCSNASRARRRSEVAKTPLFIAFLASTE
jgi:hypothetical protein